MNYNLKSFKRYQKEYGGSYLSYDFNEKILDRIYEMASVEEGEEYFNDGDIVESIYKYDTPVSIYENRHENMYCRILADVRWGEINYIYKTLYYKRME